MCNTLALNTLAFDTLVVPMPFLTTGVLVSVHVCVCNRPDSFHTVAVAVQNGMCCYHNSHSKEVDLDTPTGSMTRKRFFGLAIWLIISRFMGAVATLKQAHAMWIERSILRNVALFFGTMFVYVATQPLVGGYFNLVQLAVSCLGVLLPPLALWRLSRTRNKVSLMEKEDQVTFGLLYRVLLSQPDTLVSLDRIGVLCDPFPCTEQTFHQMTSVDTDSQFVHRGKTQMHNGRLCEPMRSIVNSTSRPNYWCPSSLR